MARAKKNRLVDEALNAIYNGEWNEDSKSLPGRSGEAGQRKSWWRGVEETATVSENNRIVLNLGEFSTFDTRSSSPPRVVRGRSLGHFWYSSPFNCGAAD